jgi:hypothetical protein
MPWAVIGVYIEDPKNIHGRDTGGGPITLIYFTDEEYRK